MKRIAQRILVDALVLLAIASVLGCERRKPARVTATTVARVVPPSVATDMPAKVAESSPSPALAEPSPSLALPSPTAPLPTLTWTPIAASATPLITPTLPTTTPTTPPTPATIRHVVRAGETLSQIARSYHTTTDAIRQANPSLTDPQQLRVGTALTVTLGNLPSVRTHRVQRGETLASIGRLYGVSMQRLVQANGLSDPNNVPAGQVLIIP